MFQGKPHKQFSGSFLIADMAKSKFMTSKIECVKEHRESRNSIWGSGTFLDESQTASSTN